METEKPRTVDPERSSTLANLSEVIGHSGVYEKGRRRRDSILTIGRDLLVEQGIGKFSLREVANRAGIKLANLQHYFKTKNELIASISLWAIHEHEKVLRDHVASSTNLSSTIRSTARFCIQDYLRSTRLVYIVLLALEPHHEIAANARQEVYRSFYEVLTRLLLEASPGTPKSEAYRAARLLTAIVDGVVVQPQNLPGSDRLVDDAIDAVAKLLEAILLPVPD